jgi:hypothetical protein
VPGWLAASLAVQGLVMGVAGVALYLATDDVLSRWPWHLTPLVARVMGAWLLAFAVAALAAVRSDIHHLGPSAIAYSVFGVLELLALALHREDAGGGLALVVYAGFLVWVSLTGAVGAWLARASGRPS